MWLLRVQLALLTLPAVVGAVTWYLDHRPLDSAVTWYLDRRPLNHHSHRKTGDR